MQSKGTKLKRLDQELNDGMEVNWDFNLNNNNGRFKFFWQNSMYGTHLEKLHKLVAPDKFHFMFYEDFVEHPNLEMEGIYRFLEIDPTETIAVKANKTGKGVIMPRNVKRLGKYVPGGLRRLLKNKIADIQHHKPSISEMEPIREGLSEEMVKLRELGLDTGKWQTTQSFLSDSKMVIHE